MGLNIEKLCCSRQRDPVTCQKSRKGVDAVTSKIHQKRQRAEGGSQEGWRKYKRREDGEEKQIQPANTSETNIKKN